MHRFAERLFVLLAVVLQVNEAKSADTEAGEETWMADIEHGVDTCQPLADDGVSQSSCDQVGQAMSLLQTRASILRVNESVDSGQKGPPLAGSVDFIVVDLVRRSEGDISPEIARAQFTRKPLPILRKHLRCIGSGPQLADCEECTGSQDCFGDCKFEAPSDPFEKYGTLSSTRICAHANESSPWTRFIVLVHINCPIAYLKVFLSADELSNSKMALYWDQDKQADIQKYEGGDAFWSLFSTHEGGHTIELEMTRPQGVGATARLRTFEIQLSSKYDKCMTTKSCLEVLDKFGSEGNALRSSNALLRQCLHKKMKHANTLPRVGPACLAWRECLQNAGDKHDEQVQLILSAAAIKTRGSTRGKSVKSCIHPPSEDPMAWDCDCYQEMHERCAAVEANMPKELKWCMRAQFCLHPDVCASWRNAVCKFKQVKPWLDKLQTLKMLESKQQLFQSRKTATIGLIDRAAQGKTGASSLDASTAMSKRCK
eukprot:gnl/TRDRNA2_/TRDRNA2_173424_c0_seq6.p1 gnl/TRDRNA2_/TRDRNA2_173424_c0~~gnl/TRDRNA2_/TRDRNA2_173424_c0_seq6.p1  ORF type:complete len:485 (+),score=60.75 gnl/TRDRNA2_/TRDRNA2_173424_c0_seq6:61-1515(+)